MRQHCRITNCRGNLNTQPANPKPPGKPEDIIEKSTYKWRGYANKQFEENISSIYEKIVYWKKNIFLLPTGECGRCCIDETTMLIDAWARGSPLKNIALKAVMIMPSLLLQKTSEDSKGKNHTKALERILKLWTDGHFAELLKEAETIQSSLKQVNAPKTIAQLSKKFVEQMQRGNVDSAIKLIINNMQNGILPLADTTPNLLKQKHPKSAPTTEEVLLPEQPESIHRIKYDNINADAVHKAALKIEGGSEPSGMDADGWKGILTSRQFAESSTGLCTTIVTVIKKLCTDKDLPNNLEVFLSCCLIPLDKNPAFQPIGVGEVLRRIVGKVIVSILRDGSITSVGLLQICAGPESGCKAAVHALSKIYKEEHTEAVLLVDAANAFSSVNRKIFLHNINEVCPSIGIYVENCYILPSRLFIIGWSEIKSSDGTTQGDPVAMPICALSVIPLTLMVLEITNTNTNSDAKMVAYANDF